MVRYSVKFYDQLNNYKNFNLLLQIYNVYSIFSHFSYSSKPCFQSYNGIIGVIYRLSAFLGCFDIVMLF